MIRRGGYNRAMQVYAGIDEAGYGPMFGPLVIARSVFVLPDADPADEPPNLWQTLGKAVSDSISDKKHRIAVNDSKKLYTPASGLKHLERGVLAFLHTAGADPTTLDEYLAALAYDGDSRQPDQLWYLDDGGGPALPTTYDSGQLAISRSQLNIAMTAAGVKLHELKAAVVYEDRFNRMVAATRSKARCAWTFVSGHLQTVWQRFGTHRPTVIVDRQGGRTRYGDPLRLLFDGADVRVIDESPLASVYEVHLGERAMTVRFEVDSEQRHMPVALASMVAKYTRELLMTRFNKFWQQHVPDVKPTKGYAADGKRFLADIEPAMGELGIASAQLVRQR